MASRIFTSKLHLSILMAMLLLLAAGVASGRAASNPKPTVINTEVGLTDAQRNARYVQAWNAFQARYSSWVAAQNLSKIDLHKLPRRPLLASYVAAPAQTLAVARARADLIIRGTVVSIMPTPFDGTYVSVEISKTLKGDARGVIVIHQAGGIRPTTDWSGMFIADSEAAPLILPGDDIVALLQRHVEGYEAQPFTGLYLNTTRGLRAVPGNPFGSSVDGQAALAFQTLMSASAQ